MPDTKKNALTELANELTWVEEILRSEGYGSYCEEVKKAQRIIAELAKVEDVDMVHNLEYVRVPNSRHCYDAVVKCRAIAEEGENNGNR